MNDILVSIWCVTYNHELYIRDAIEGFLSQKLLGSMNRNTPIWCSVFIRQKISLLKISLV